MSVSKKTGGKNIRVVNMFFYIKFLRFRVTKLNGRVSFIAFSLCSFVFSESQILCVLCGFF